MDEEQSKDSRPENKPEPPPEKAVTWPPPGKGPDYLTRVQQQEPPKR
jgi:hypothetical protein